MSDTTGIGGPGEVVLYTVLSGETILGEEILDHGPYIDVKNAVFMQVNQAAEGISIRFIPATEFDAFTQSGDKAPTIRLVKSAIFHMSKPNTDIAAKYRQSMSSIVIADATGRVAR